MSENEDRVVWRPSGHMIPIKIPDDCIKCPTCKGSGKTRWRWSEPGFFNNPAESDYHYCITCMGKGYVEKDLYEKMEKLEQSFQSSASKVKTK